MILTCSGYRVGFEGSVFRELGGGGGKVLNNPGFRVLVSSRV